MQRTSHEDLSAYLDGELTDAETAELEAELARDPALREELRDLEAAVEWMREEGPVAAPFGFHRRVMDRIEAESPEREPWWRRPFGVPLEGWVLVAAAAAVLISVLPSSPESSGTPAPDEVSPAAQRMPDIGQPTKSASPPEPSSEVATPAVDPAGDSATAKEKTAVSSSRTPKRRFEKVVPPPPTKTEAPKEPLKEAPEAGPERGTAEVETPVKTDQEPGVEWVVINDNPEVKRNLLAASSRFGRPVGEDGEEPTSAVFDGSPEYIEVEVRQGNLPDLFQSLQDLGLKITDMKDGQLLKGDTVVVRLRLVPDERGEDAAGE